VRHLGGRESDAGGKSFALGRRQVALLPEAPLELADLRVREQHAPLASLQVRQGGGHGRRAVRNVAAGGGAERRGDAL